MAYRGDRTKDRKMNGNGQERRKKPERENVPFSTDLGYCPFTEKVYFDIKGDNVHAAQSPAKYVGLKYM